LFLGSSCIYPKLAPQPMNEDLLLTGPLEPTNQWYAVAKAYPVDSGDATCCGLNDRIRSVAGTTIDG
jgi:hypothetical protein